WNAAPPDQTGSPLDAGLRYTSATPRCRRHQRQAHRRHGKEAIGRLKSLRGRHHLHSEFLQLQPKLLCALILDDAHTQMSGLFEIFRAVVDEDAFLGGALSDLQCFPVDFVFRLLDTEKTRAEECGEVLGKVKLLDAMNI